MASRRSISDIVAVIMLVIIAIAAAAIIYAWLSGFIGGLRSSGASATSVKLQITGVSVSGSTVTIYLDNPSGSAATTIDQVVLEYTNGTVITATSASFSLTPNEIASTSVSFGSLSIPAGTPVEVVVYTTSGYYTSYQFTWS